MTIWHTEIKAWRIAVLFILISASGLASLATYRWVTRPKYYRLDYHMSMQQVIDIMGDPEVRWECGMVEVWTYSFPHARDRKSLALYFQDGKLEGTMEKWTPWPPEHEKLP